MLERQKESKMMISLDNLEHCPLNHGTSLLRKAKIEPRRQRQNLSRHTSFSMCPSLIRIYYGILSLILSANT